jgi:hypothetical protein
VNSPLFGVFIDWVGPKQVLRYALEATPVLLSLQGKWEDRLRTLRFPSFTLMQPLGIVSENSKWDLGPFEAKQLRLRSHPGVSGS